MFRIELNWYTNNFHYTVYFDKLNIELSLLSVLHSVSGNNNIRHDYLVWIKA